MVGKRWELVHPSVTTLAERGDADFLGPMDLPGESIRADLVLVAPEAAGVAAALSVPGAPPVLLCVPWQGLDSEDLYPQADDFVAVPCSAGELAKRIARLAGRALPMPVRDLGAVIRVGDVTLNTETYEVTVSGAPVSLAWMEFQLLRFLAQNPGKIFRREEILQHVWGTDYIGGLRTVDVHIRRLRNKLGREGERSLRTVRNVGYGLERES
jgi:hypothetical protein